MSVAAAIPDQTSASPVTSPAEDDELAQWYAEHGDDDNVDVNVPVPPPIDTTTTTTTTPATAPEQPTGTEPSATAATTAPTAPAPSPSWRDEIDTNPNLPKSLQGKTRGEVYDANVRARWDAMEAGRQKNDAERELLVTKGLLTALRDTAPKPAPAPAAPQPKPHEIFGLAEPDAAYGAVPQIVEKLPGYIEQRASEIAEARTAPLERALGDMQQQAVIAAAESARFAVRDRLKVDPEAFEGITPALKTYLYLNRLDPRVQQNWEAAFVDLQSKAARIVPQTAALPTVAPPAGSATSIAAAPVAPRRAVSTGDKKADAMIANQLVTFFGHTRGTAKFDEAFKKAVDSFKAEKRGLED